MAQLDEDKTPSKIYMYVAKLNIARSTVHKKKKKKKVWILHTARSLDAAVRAKLVPF